MFFKNFPSIIYIHSISTLLILSLKTKAMSLSALIQDQSVLEPFHCVFFVLSFLSTFNCCELRFIVLQSIETGYFVVKCEQGLRVKLECNPLKTLLSLSIQFSSASPPLRVNIIRPPRRRLSLLMLTFSVVTSLLLLMSLFGSIAELVTNARKKTEKRRESPRHFYMAGHDARQHQGIIVRNCRDKNIEKRKCYKIRDFTSRL